MAAYLGNARDGLASDSGSVVERRTIEMRGLVHVRGSPANPLGSPLGILRVEGRKSGINDPMGISNRVYRSVRVSPRSQAGDYSDAK
jgi:hypothetical protein